MHAPLRILQLGPLYNNHLRRWSQHAVAMGRTVYAAGHVRPGRRRLDLSDLADAVEVSPEPVEAIRDSHVAWLRSVLERLKPDLMQAHYLPRWPYVSALVGYGPVIATPWGSDLYLADGEARRRADYALRHADAVIARSPHMQRELLARGVAAERIHPVDLGVNLERFSPRSEPGRRAAGDPQLPRRRRGLQPGRGARRVSNRPPAGARRHPGARPR